MEREDNLKLTPPEAGVVRGFPRGMEVAATHQFYIENDVYVDGGLLITTEENIYCYEAIATATALETAPCFVMTLLGIFNKSCFASFA